MIERLSDFGDTFLRMITGRMVIASIIGFIVGVSFLAFMLWLGSEERAFSKIAKAQLKKQKRYRRITSSPPEGDLDEVMPERFKSDLRMRL